MARFNATDAIIQKPDPSIFLMAVVVGFANKTKFKEALEMDSLVDLVDLYYCVRRARKPIMVK